MADRHAVLGGLGAAVLLVATAQAGGGYLPSTWGWAALASASLAVAVLAVHSEIVVTRAGALFVSGLAALVAWTALSTLWSDSVPRTVAEVERNLVYLTAVGALALAPRAREGVLGGTLAATSGICAAALSTRLFPGQFGFDAESGYRLARPLGYWNGLGLLAAMGSLLALGVLADARSRAARAAAAASLVVSSATLLFTLSRGAWLALGAGLLLTAALHPARLRYALTASVAAIPAAAAVVLCGRAEELTGAPSSADAASSQGHRLAAGLALLASAALATPFVLDALLPRLPRPSPALRRAFATAAAVGAGVALLTAVAFAGRAYDAFRTPQRFGEQSLAARLLSVSGQNRSEYWQVAAGQYRDRPVLGSGSGTYDLYWTRERELGLGARSAHSLYLETVAELGPIGLVLLGAVVAAPFVALRTARRLPYAAPLAGAWGAYLAHAAADWDWELPTVTLAGLAAASALAASDERRFSLRPSQRRVGAAAAALLCAAAVAVQLGSSAQSQAAAALRSGRHADAIAGAQRAARWAPWASEPWRIRADAERALGRNDAARRSARTAVARDPRDWLAWFQLARLTSGAERVSAAARMRELNPLAPPLDSGPANE